MNYRKFLLNNTFLKFGFLFTLAMILVAGLWPFNFWPKNEVEWLKDRNGVHFYGQGIIFSALDPGSSQSPLLPDGPITIEIWLRPDRPTFAYLPRILSVFDGKESEAFFLGQWKSHFAVSTQTLDAKGGWIYRNTGVENVFSKGEDRYIAVTADEKGTRIYINGGLELVYPNYSLLPEDRKNLKQIILGNSPTGKGNWEGNLYGLAFYRRSLTPDQVQQHFKGWLIGKPPSSLNSDNQALISYFPFSERAGTRIRDLISSRDLLILPGFQAPQKVILSLPWKDFRLNLSYLRDIGTNILGFIPFGFFISVLFRKRMKSGLNLYISGFLLGLFLSLFIEITQVYLPTRNSQLTDVITNTIGALLGTGLFHVFYQSRIGQGVAVN